MEEAYVIGIRLALDNGVSAGVASIRQDLGALDQTIATTAAHLSDLAAISAAATSAAGQQIRQTPSEPAATASIEAEFVPTPAPTSRSQSPNDLPPPPATSAPQITSHPQAPPMAPQPQSAQPQQPVETPSVPAQAINPSGIAPVTTNAAVKPALPVKSERQVAPPAVKPARAQPAVQIALQAAPLQTAPSVPPGTTPAAATAKPTQTSGQPVPAPASPAAPTGGRDSDRGPIATHTHMAAPPTQEAAPPLRSAARRAGPAAAPVSPAAAAVRAPMIPSVAPQSAPSSTQPTGGDVYLDGARLGHWLANQLSRGASRPPNGATGFDPRLGISWPGAQQGGG